MARRGDNARRALQLARHIAGDELLDHLAAELGAQIPARDLLAIAENGQRLRVGVELRLQRGETLIAHQHQEIDLGQVPRRCGSKRPGPFSIA